MTNDKLKSLAAHGFDELPVHESSNIKVSDLSDDQLRFVYEIAREQAIEAEEEMMRREIEEEAE